jgi:hypothetical protein
MRAFASRWPLVVALLMGAAVGPYTDFSSPQALDAALTIAALALPMLLSVALDHAIPSRPAALAKVGAPILIIAALLLANAMNPAIWQSYASSAGWFSLLPAMVLAPLCAGFFSGAGTNPLAPAAPFAYAARKSLAWRCGALAWLGVGIHDLVILYVIPFIGLIVFLVTGTPASQGRGGLFSVFFLATLLIGLFVLFVTGFGLAIPTGLGGEALHARLRRVPLAVAP